MTETEVTNPWETLDELLDSPDGAGARAGAYLDSLSPQDALLALSHLNEKSLEELLEALPAEEASDVVSLLPNAQVVPVLTRLEPPVAAAILHELPSDSQADLLSAVGAEPAEAILACMEPEQASDARKLSGYADDQAGGLMNTEYLAYPEYTTVGGVVDDLRANAEEYAAYNVQYIYVVSRRGRLVGVLRIRDLLLVGLYRKLTDLMIRNPLSVVDTTPLERLNEFFEQRELFGAPVVNARGRLVSVIDRTDVNRALAERASSDYRKAQGLVDEEVRSMPLVRRARRRLAWLSINVVLNVIAASVIALYQDTIAQVIALAVFLPIISDMSGCSGNQAVAVSVRELTLGLIKTSEVVRVWLKEVAVGLINGLVLGVLVAVAGLAYSGSPWFGLVVGTALMLNTIVAASIGGTVPLILRHLGKDPALASGPILTTITDMCGFFFVLGFASMMIPLLTGS